MVYGQSRYDTAETGATISKLLRSEDLSRILILDKSGKTPLVNIWLTDEVYFGGVTLAFHLLIWKVKMLEKQQN